VQKLWSILFLGLLVFGVWFFYYGMTTPGMWLPDQASTYAHDVDYLFNVILWITGIAFVLTEGALVWFLFRYHAAEGRKATYIHHHTKAEVIWTVVPAVILAYIAYAQYDTWNNIKRNPMLTGPEQKQAMAQIVARQFEWRFRYAGLDGQPGVAGVDDDNNGTADDWDEWGYPGSDDVESVNELHVPVGEKMVFHLRSFDVLHSFFVPDFRVKQDAVPGLVIPLWFQVLENQLESGQAYKDYDLLCAELCGWGHFKMQGKVRVHTADGFREWLRETEQKYRDPG